MFSDRTAWITRPSPLSVAIAERRALPGLIDLTASNPTAVDLPPLAPELIAALADPAVGRYDPDPAGPLPARAAVASYYASLGYAVDPEHLRLSASTSEAYGWLFNLLCDRGDAVVVGHPSYPLLDDLARLEGVALTPVGSTWHGRWELDLDALDEAITPSTRAIALVHPNNPSGAYVTLELREALLARCRQHGLALLVDEVFLEYPHREDPRRAPSFVGCDEVLTFTLSGLSKTLALPQMKLGWVHVGGPDALRSEALRRLEHIADSFLSVGAPVLRAAPVWLRHREALQRPVRERIARNLATLKRAITAESPVSLLPVEGGWSAVLRLPATRDDDAWVLALLERGVLVQPGYFFDVPGDGHMVLSLLPRTDQFEEGVARLSALVAEDCGLTPAR
ncbi:MAG: pyridoxal phosphate-dependent aminotransferase [Myxococcaceae bacterium]|nr:MAG: pyridoxal phosphate-dependent aminotransferase [Myxococcaceae bacterium]